MKQCWRWFGPKDPIGLGALHEVGVEGIVTALHDLAPGAVWSSADIAKRQALLRANRFEWDVVESLIVSEAIKTQSSEMGTHLSAYKESLSNLAEAGITTVCYNFMPILDWTRTALRAPQPNGAKAMAFSLLDFAVFDRHILERKGAHEDYPAEVVEAAKERFQTLSFDQRAQLQTTIIAGLPGANEGWSLEDMRAQLATYKNITAENLRSNLIDFLSEVGPEAERLGIKLCCHPDDPPFPLLGLPRVMSSTEDYAQVLDTVDLPANGTTLCTGSLGVSTKFDAPDFVRRLGPKIHFVHLRNTKRTPSLDPERPDFFEAAHLEGDTDMVATIHALVGEEDRRKREGRSDCVIPMRPDHGQELLSDKGGHSLPGYPLIGRARGLAELRGIMAALAR
ncbi:MAG: mannonate dehydratase [Pseudomonadota bacterium]